MPPCARRQRPGPRITTPSRDWPRPPAPCPTRRSGTGSCSSPTAPPTALRRRRPRRRPRQHHLAEVADEPREAPVFCDRPRLQPLDQVHLQAHLEPPCRGPRRLFNRGRKPPIRLFLFFPGQSPGLPCAPPVTCNLPTDSTPGRHRTSAVKPQPVRDCVYGVRHRSHKSPICILRFHTFPSLPSLTPFTDKAGGDSPARAHFSLAIDPAS